MYSITVINSTGVEYTLYNAYDDSLKVVDPTLDLELNKSGTLTFQISSDHPSIDQIRPLASEIRVYRDDVLFWVGRPLSVEEAFDLMMSVTCEGIMGYLLDTQVPPFDFTGSNSITGSNCVRTFLNRLITSHNSRLTSNWADSRKKFSVGTVTVTDSNNNLARSAEGYASTLDTINEKLLATHGGYLRVRVSGSTRYIDYIETFGAATQPISFGDNLLDLSKHTNTDTLATVIVPLGAQPEGSEQRISLAGYTPTTSIANRISQYTHGGRIMTASGGSSSFSSIPAIYDAVGVANHGMIFVVVEFNDVTTQQNLALKAAEFIGNVSVLGTMIELSAVDLSSIDVDYDTFVLGQVAPVVSIHHGVNAEYQITKMSIGLADPAKSSMVLGGKLGTLTFDNTKQIADVIANTSSEISEAVQNATALLSGGLGGYLIIRQDDTGQPYEILIMNAATEAAATRCVRLNQNGLGFGRSSAGSTSWTYRNAWTIDGNLLADFITAGKLTAGTVGGFNIGTNSISKGTAGQSGSVYISPSIIRLGANFAVSSSGYLTAKSGVIGGFSIGTSAIYHGTRGAAGSIFLDTVNGISLGGRFSVDTNGDLRARNLVTGYQDVYGSITLGLTDANYLNLEPPGSAGYTMSMVRSNVDRFTLENDGTVVAKEYRTFSDRRLKTDIELLDADESAGFIFGLKPVSYRLIPADDDEESPIRHGFIAQDVEQLLTDDWGIISEDRGGHLSLSYTEIIADLVNTVQAQNKRIDRLEEEIKKMRGEKHG